VIGAGNAKLPYKQIKKRISNRAGSDEREMKVTSSKACKIQMVKEGNEKRQEKHALVWRSLDLGDPATVPCLCKQGAAAWLKHPQRKTLAAAIVMQSKSSVQAEICLCFGDCLLSLTC